MGMAFAMAGAGLDLVAGEESAQTEAEPQQGEEGTSSDGEERDG